MPVPEAFKVIRCGLGQLKELGEQILGSLELHGQLAGLKTDRLRQTLHLVASFWANRDFNSGRLAILQGFF